ncbi:MAG: nickel pincer cofactor biosynthesis protein LarC [Candidatus Eisenbacteria bacterium]
MKLGYFDCFAGASGDMILASLFDVGLKQSDLTSGLASLKIEDIEVVVGDVMRSAVRAKSFSFTHRADPVQRSFKHIVEIVESSGLPDGVKAKSVMAFDAIAAAESRIHGVPKSDVHFHEIGSVDSIVDVVGSFIGFEALGIEKMVSSPLALGSGRVECQHGTLPVPAPATLEIARGLPVRSWGLTGELTTPTGAAILKTCASEFGPIPSMTVTDVGYGAGSRELEGVPNVLRLIIGETRAFRFDTVTLIETNIDDMNPEFFSHIYDDLFSRGALDVWVTNILMKKGRPGFLLGVLAESQHVTELADCILSGTTTSGVRLREVERIKLDRESIEVETRYGKVKAKVFKLDTERRCAPEYDDCLRVARASGVPVNEVMEETRNVFRHSLTD